MNPADDDRALAAVARLPVTFRPLLTRVVLLTMGTLLLAVLSTLAVVMPHEGASPWTTGDRVTMVVVGVLAMALLTLLSRPKAVAEADGLTVVNLTVKRRLAWAEVLAVRLRPGDAWVHLDLADGTTLAVMGIQPGIARQQALDDARRLRALVEALGEAPGDGRGGG
ncbi:PH domain-containing protein [Actinacidiphila paucisporea]|uniref:PH domain-containing protein n=1 Tax=Actinacidiphila paucisporea TaxID=310782 RepID=A0A1M7QDB3_9ACTN|nr:PH domain-containing protein [Actinacidiphila paucisporea]